jgi:hypothetical protein
MTETVDQAQAQPPRALAGIIEDATSLSFVSTSHFEGLRGGRLTSRRHRRISGKAVTSVPVTPYTTSADVNPRDARLDDTSSAAPVKLTGRPQRFAGPVRCWRPGCDTGSGRCGPDRESGHRGQQLAGKDGFMLDHLSIQCADVAAGATFYDAALPARRTPRDGLRGGHRLRCAAQARVLDRPVDRRRGVPRDAYRVRGTRQGCRAGILPGQRSALMPKCSMNRVWPEYPPGLLRRLCA